jgi:hypothetical protein
MISPRQEQAKSHPRFDKADLRRRVWHWNLNIAPPGA